MRQYINNLGSALSQLLNATLGGNPDITLSARTYIEADNGKLWARVLRPVIDAVFFWDKGHTKNAAIRDRENALKTILYFQTLKG